MKRAMEDLALRPYSAVDEELATASLPMPMFTDNWPIQHNTCIMADEFKELVTEANGFEWVRARARALRGLPQVPRGIVGLRHEPGVGVASKGGWRGP